MALSFRVIFWFPVICFFILNLIFKAIIFLLQHFGNGIVWCNRQFIKAGNYFTDLAKNDDGIDNFLKELQKTTTETKARVKARRNK